MIRGSIVLFAARKVFFLAQLLYLISSVFVADFSCTGEFIEDLSEEHQTNSPSDPFSDLLDDSSEDAGDVKVVVEEKQLISFYAVSAIHVTVSNLSCKKGMGYPDQLFSPPDYI
jgi:hypothetical protein